MDSKDVLLERDSFIKEIQDLGAELDPSAPPEMITKIAEEFFHDLVTLKT